MLDGHAITLSIGLTRTGVKAADIKRFWSKVDKSGECWLWTASRKPNGYGQFTKKPLLFYAHRVAYEATYGPIPAGLIVCHRCDNPPCVRPDHLFLGTDLDNAQDRVAKGRSTRGRSINAGERNGHAKLTPTNVIAIKRAHATGQSKAALARRYAVSPRTIADAIRGATWPHVREEAV